MRKPSLPAVQASRRVAFFARAAVPERGAGAPAAEGRAREGLRVLLGLGAVPPRAGQQGRGALGLG